MERPKKFTSLMPKMRFLRYIAIALVGITLGYVVGKCDGSSSSVVYRDKIVPYKSEVIKYVYIPKPQLLIFRDTVQVPIERVVYKEKEFEATIVGPTIGGHKPMLESFNIHRQIKPFTPYASVMLGKDVFSIGGGVTIKEKHGIGIEYLNLGGKSAIGYKYTYNF